MAKREDCDSIGIRGAGVGSRGHGPGAGWSRGNGRPSCLPGRRRGSGDRPGGVAGPDRGCPGGRPMAGGRSGELGCGRGWGEVRGGGMGPGGSIRSGWHAPGRRGPDRL